MTPLRILTIDDETLALRRLALLLRSIPYVDHVGEANSCGDALVKIASLRPDALLLDIKMRDGTGFDLAERLAESAHPPVIVFVTAFDQFAVRAFETSAADYLLKPVERDRLVQALAKVRMQMKASDAQMRVGELQEVISDLRSARIEGMPFPFESEFWLRGSAGVVRVPLDAIECVSSEDDYVALHTHAGSHLMRSSIRQFAARVEPSLFVRVHRRWLVRRREIAEISVARSTRLEIILKSGRRVPVGRVYLKSLRQSIRATPQPPRLAWRTEARPAARPGG